MRFATLILVILAGCTDKPSPALDAPAPDTTDAAPDTAIDATPPCNALPGEPCCTTEPQCIAGYTCGPEGACQ